MGTGKQFEMSSRHWNVRQICPPRISNCLTIPMPCSFTQGSFPATGIQPLYNYKEPISQYITTLWVTYVQKHNTFNWRTLDINNSTYPFKCDFLTRCSCSWSCSPACRGCWTCGPGCGPLCPPAWPSTFGRTGGVAVNQISATRTEVDLLLLLFYESMYFLSMSMTDWPARRRVNQPTDGHECS